MKIALLTLLLASLAIAGARLLAEGGGPATGVALALLVIPAFIALQAILFILFGFGRRKG